MCDHEGRNYSLVILLKCRCREKQRKEASRLQNVNRKLTAMNKLLMEENDRLQKQVTHLVYENGYFRQNHPRVVRVLFFSLVRAFFDYVNIWHNLV